MATLVIWNALGYFKVIVAHFTLSYVKTQSSMQVGNNYPYDPPKIPQHVEFFQNPLYL